MRFSVESVRQSIKNKGYIVFALFILFITFTRMFPVYPERATVYMMLFFLAVLAFPLRGEGVRGKAYRIFDVLLIIATVAFALYLIFDYRDVIMRQGAPSVIEVALGATALIVTLELTRRTMFPLFLLCLGCVLYAIFGEYFPGIFGTPGYSIERITGHLSLTMHGLLGLGTDVLIKYIIPFIIFGCLLRAAGAMDILASLTARIVGKTTGGPAKISVASSSLFGMLSGSSVANVLFTGTFTIPLMKRYGYKSAYAAGVEGCSSTGGQLVPPVMGTAAFMMADITGIPYLRIILAAFLPAVLYYAGVFTQVHFDAKRRGFGKPAEDLGIIITSFSKLIPKLVPIVMVIAILVAGLAMWSPTRAVLVAIAASIPLSFIHRDTRLTPTKILAALRESIETFLPVGVACIAIGIIIGVASLTGIGLKFSELMLLISGEKLFLLLLVAAVACIILGMGVAGTVVYVFVAIMLAPGLIKLGIPLMAAHFFLLYSATLADITPPVCLAIYAAAGIAGANPMRAGWEGVKIGFVKFLLPFYIVLRPELLLEGDILSIILVFLSGFAMVVSISAVIVGYLHRSLAIWERILLGAVGLTLICSGNYAINLGVIGITSIGLFVSATLKRRS